LPFTFGVCHWPWPSQQTEHSQNWYFCMQFNIQFLLGPSGIGVSRVVVWEERARAIQVRISAGEWLQAARLLRFCIRIPPGAWIFFCCECRVLSEISATSWSLVQRSPTDCVASSCVI
jgi:hypothetical protein